MSYFSAETYPLLIILVYGHTIRIHIHAYVPYVESSSQSYEKKRLKNALCKLNGHHHECVNIYDMSVSKRTNCISTKSSIVIEHPCLLSDK